jgi:hypothetical protein
MPRRRNRERQRATVIGLMRSWRAMLRLEYPREARRTIRDRTTIRYGVEPPRLHFSRSFCAFSLRDNRGACGISRGTVR